MKKWIFALTGIIMFFAVACNDSSSDSIAAPQENPEELSNFVTENMDNSQIYDFYAVIHESSPDYQRGLLNLYVYSNENHFSNDIDSLIVEIDGQELPMEKKTIYWVGSYPFVRNQIYDFRFVVDENEYETPLKIAEKPFVTNHEGFPWAWDLSKPLDIRWTMEESNMYQGMYVYSTNVDLETEEHFLAEEYFDIGSDARSVEMMPFCIQTFGKGTLYCLTLEEINYVEVDNFILLSFGNLSNHWSLGENGDKRTLNQFQNAVKRLKKKP